MKFVMILCVIKLYMVRLSYVVESRCESVGDTW